ncbi:hypothetical protein I601_2065 [Nocardioides dokdonensis FR1436]|uniref:DUF4245 domain-containing protein n=1 Tax=Nocardioides dokdonensis FR1436 TaxID=1300347 RepID=A0A1A9GLL4_9ACTN|nr:DUF4245 family protein [Nocardioides dokdonensis]ANH38493.1 hypothetical protein I601_2065 [Nocardioides dokdonensis FR1436]
MSQTGQPGRYTRSTNGFIGAMLILVVAVIGTVLIAGLFRSEPEYTPSNADYTEVVRAVQGEGVELVYPEALPSGWLVNNVSYEPGSPPTFALALLTEEKTYAGLQVEGEDVDDLVEVYVDEGATEGDPLVLQAGESSIATQWRTFTDEEGDTAYAAEVGRGARASTVLVYGSATPAELQALLRSLTTAPLS